MHSEPRKRHVSRSETRTNAFHSFGRSHSTHLPPDTVLHRAPRSLGLALTHVTMETIIMGGGGGGANISAPKICIIYRPSIARKTHIGRSLMLTLKLINCFSTFALVIMHFECKGHCFFFLKELVLIHVI